MSRARLVLLLMLAPTLLAAKCRDKKIEEVPDDTITVDIPAVDVALQIISIDPALGDANKPFSARIYGSEFAQGSTVSFSGTPASSVTFVDANTLDVMVPALPEGSVDITVKLPSGQQSTLRRGLSLMAANANAVCDKATIYFDLDSNSLRPDQRTALNALVPCLSRRTERIRLEGHTDERGTTDYNLALGQRRANAVREYLVSQGVPPSRIDSVTYGEERPTRAGSGEDVWSANRRVELRVTR